MMPSNSTVGMNGWVRTVRDQNSGDQVSEADIDRKIIDLGRAVALNPKNANAHRERALLYLRKRDLDSALSIWTERFP